MADKEEEKRPEEQKEQSKDQSEETKTEDNEKKSLVGRLLPILMIIFVVGLCSGGGFFLGRVLGGSDEQVEADIEIDQSDIANAINEGNSSGDGSDCWYYDLEPVIANLNEPSVTRYVSASLTFEMSSTLDKDKGTEYLEEKKPIIINWMTIYLSGLGLDDIRGDKNLMSIKSHIRDSLNEILFPDSKPQINDVLIQKFPVQ